MSHAPAVRHGNGKTGELLLLDDQETVREVISDGLRRLGWSVTAFANPQAALTAWGDHRPAFAIALVDMVMPGMNGASVFRALRARDPSARVVLMSGHTGGNSIDALMAEGLAGYVEKPIKLRPLTELLSNLIEEQNP